MTHTQVFEITDPTDTDKEGLGAQSIRETLRDFQERMEVDHNFDKTSTDDSLNDSDGTHKKVSLDNSETVSAGVANAIILHAEDVSGSAELFAMTEADTDTQITDGVLTLYPDLRYAYASDPSARSFSSASWTDDTNMDLTITVKENDIVIVNFVGMFLKANTIQVRGISAGVRIVLESGDATALLLSNEPMILQYSYYSGQAWACQAVYQATADGNLVFRNQVKRVWNHATHYLINRNAIAYVVNRS